MEASPVTFEKIIGEDEEDTSLLREMADEAVRYVRSQPWCLGLKQKYFADGIGGIVAICLFQVAIKDFDTEKWIWVFTGDIPPAYMLVDSCKTPFAALTQYADGLEAWAKEAEKGRTSSDLMPVNVAPTPEHASMALSRVATLREHVLPDIRRG